MHEVKAAYDRTCCICDGIYCIFIVYIVTDQIRACHSVNERLLECITERLFVFASLKGLVLLAKRESERELSLFSSI